MPDEAEALASLFGHDLAAGKAKGPPRSTTSAPVKPVRIWATVFTGIALSGLWVRFSTQYLSPAAAGDWFGLFPGEVGFELAVFGGLLGIAIVMARLAVIPISLQRVPPLPGFCVGLMSGVAGLLLSLMLSWVGGHVRTGGAPDGIGPTLLVLGGFMVLFEAAVEEYVFRAWLQRRLIEVIGEGGAVALASIIFALMHILGGERSGTSLANIFLAGLFFGLLALRTGGIAASTGAHFGWNWAETGVLGLAPNPGTSVFGAMFDLDISGSALWGGSTEGLNASIAVTLVLVALSLPLLAMGRTPQPT